MWCDAMKCNVMKYNVMQCNVMYVVMLCVVLCVVCGGVVLRYLDPWLFVNTFIHAFTHSSLACWQGVILHLQKGLFVVCMMTSLCMCVFHVIYIY
jgi:hypothetical protein